ncbi:hypothetical protein FAUST_11088 [Fusarium austroamericanum]|uniref:HNH nuclease domain-containing protein n=1 Tax=Fusarium austroamericanum TaxID=282268 RepID=A0AAN6BVG4_FUSAU|nr:hypothetical protein FAUST_11088 [Fusarium austroamericanum]
MADLPDTERRRASLTYVELHKGDLETTREERFECAKKIEEKLRHVYKHTFPLTAIHASIILLVPEGCLKDGGFLDPDQPSSFLKQALKHVAELVGHFIQKSNEDRWPADPTQSKGSGETVPTERSLKRPRAAIDSGSAGPESITGDDTDTGYCRQRDNFQCILTATPGGQVAHIVPLAWDNNKGNSEKTFQAIVRAEAFFSEAVVTDLVALIANTYYLGGSNKDWNMLSLNERLYSWWPQGFFGFKFLGIKHLDSQNPDDEASEDQETEVMIQFNWLECRQGKPNDQVAVMGSSNSMEDLAKRQLFHEANGNPAPDRNERGIIAAEGMDAHKSIIPGHVVPILMPFSDAKKCKLMIDLQWDLIQIAAMNGGARHPELLPKPYVYDLCKRLRRYSSS